MNDLLATVGSLGNTAAGILDAVKGNRNTPANAQTGVTTQGTPTAPTGGAGAWTKWAIPAGIGLVVLVGLVLALRRK